MIITVCTCFSEGYVRSTLIVPGNAAATAENILASEWLFRVGFVRDLIAFVCDAAVSILLYLLLRPVHRTVALIAAAFRLNAHPAIANLNLLNHFAALKLVDGTSYLAAFDTGQLHSLAMLFLDAHTVGYLFAGVFLVSIVFC